jgi:hypothetical protein
MEEAQNYINSSTLTYFRKKIGLLGVKMIEEAVRKVIRNPPGGRKRGPKNRDITVDTTVVESPVKYPTDINLLETCREKCVEAIDEGRKSGCVKKKTPHAQKKSSQRLCQSSKTGTQIKTAA